MVWGDSPVYREEIDGITRSTKTPAVNLSPTEGADNLQIVREQQVAFGDLSQVAIKRCREIEDADSLPSALKKRRTKRPFNAGKILDNW